MTGALAALLLVVSAHAARPRVVVGVRTPLVNLSPFAAQTIEEYRVTTLAFETLARVNPADGTLKPWLAERWRMEKGVLRITLRARVRTHDDRQLTAANVVETVARYRDPRNRAATWLASWQKITRVRASGALDVLVEGRDLDFDDVKAFLTTLRVRPATGPFTLGEIASGRVLLNARDGWWHGPAPAFDLLFKPVADETLARQLVNKRELDYFADVDGPGARVTGSAGLWLDVSLRRAPFADRDVRRAVLELWDRAALNRRLFAGRWRVAADAFDPRATAGSAVAPIAFAPSAARARLRRAGYREGRPLDFEVLVTSAADERWVSLLQSDLAKAGVNVRLTRVVADPALFARLREGRFDAVAGGGGLPFAVDRAAWRSDGAYNVAGFKSDRADQLIDRLARTFAPAARRTLTRRAIALLREELVQLPGLTRDFATALTSPRLAIDPARPDEIWRWRVIDRNLKDAH